MPSDRLQSVARVLWVTLALNLIVAIAKLLYGYRSGALAISADGLHSLLDGSSNIIGLVAVAVARRPPDANHPYGHRKYETFAALGVAAMMFYGCAEIAKALFERLRSPRVPDIDAVGFVIIGATLLVNLFVVWFERREGRRLGSELLLADSAHTQSDVLASGLVLLSFVALNFGLGWADVVVAVFILVLIVRAGFVVARITFSTLSDERRVDPAEVEEEAVREPGVLEAHNVRSRGAQDDIYIDMHVLVAPETPLARAHAVGHRVEERLRKRWTGVTDVVVHVEPALESERAHTREGGGLKAKD